MKKYCFILAIICALAFGASGQVYTVKAVRGNIYFNHKVLKAGDQINDPKTLTSNDRKSVIRLLNPQAGSILVSFANARPTVAGSGQSHFELYELTLQNYIQGYTAQRTLTTKAVEGFDWLTFFTTADKGKMAVFEDQAIPLTGKKLDASKLRFKAVIYSEKDSQVTPMPVANDSLRFVSSIFKPDAEIRWKLLVDYDENGTQQTAPVTDNGIAASVISKSSLSALLKDFETDWHDSYATAEEARKDFYTYLYYNYGSFYKPAISGLVDKAFTK
jgi:hypothetical protein